LTAFAVEEPNGDSVAGSLAKAIAEAKSRTRRMNLTPKMQRAIEAFNCADIQAHLEGLRAVSASAETELILDVRGCQTPTVGLPDTHRLARGCQTPTVWRGVARHPPFGEGGCQTPTVWLVVARHPPFGEGKSPVRERGCPGRLLRPTSLWVSEFPPGCLNSPSPRRPAAGSGIIWGWTAPKLRPAGDRPKDVLHVSKV
jgi:hypothetical protein